MQDHVVVQNASTQERVIVQEYSLADFTFKVSSLVQQGYVPSEENEGYPLQIGVLYTCTMLKVKQKESNPNQLELDLEVKAQVQPDTQPEVKTRGRAKKV